ncbi:MAG: polysaccharide deacetylase family protein [Solirubrobacteraceae bacterium]
MTGSSQNVAADSAGSPGDFADFTEASYRELLRAARRRFRFEFFGTACDEPHVIWRHDVDFSVHRSASLARIEQEEGVVSTYFFLFHSSFYNLFERSVADLAREIAGRGHRVGLHFDSGFYDRIDSITDLAEKLNHEAGLLGDLLRAPVEAFAYHNPGSVHDDLAFDGDVIAGLANAYGRTLRERYAYVSDSNGYWRFQRLLDLLVEGSDDRLQVVTHPAWWQVNAMPPRQRIVRCVEGRATRTLRDYDDALVAMGRSNVK